MEQLGMRDDLLIKCESSEKHVNMIGMRSDDKVRPETFLWWQFKPPRPVLLRQSFVSPGLGATIDPPKQLLSDTFAKSPTFLSAPYGVVMEWSHWVQDNQIP